MNLPYDLMSMQLPPGYRYGPSRAGSVDFLEELLAELERGGSPARNDPYFMMAPYLGPSNHLPMSGGPMYRLPDEPERPLGHYVTAPGKKNTAKAAKSGKAAKSAKGGKVAKRSPSPSYVGNTGRYNFDTLDRNDPRAQAYMARRFREAGVQNPTDYSESSYQSAREAKADAYNERRKKHRERVADNIRPQGRAQTGTERNRNRQRMGLVPSERGRQAERAEQRRRLMAEMFGNYRGY